MFLSLLAGRAGNGMTLSVYLAHACINILVVLTSIMILVHGFSHTVVTLVADKLKIYIIYIYYISRLNSYPSLSSYSCSGLFKVVSL